MKFDMARQQRNDERAWNDPGRALQRRLRGPIADDHFSENDDIGDNKQKNSESEHNPLHHQEGVE